MILQDLSRLVCGISCEMYGLTTSLVFQNFLLTQKTKA